MFYNSRLQYIIISPSLKAHNKESNYSPKTFARCILIMNEQITRNFSRIYETIITITIVSRTNLSPILVQDYHCMTHQRTIMYLFSSVHTWSKDQLRSIKVLLVFCMSHVDSLILRTWIADVEMHDRQEAQQMVLRNFGLVIGSQVILEVYVVEDWNKIRQCKGPHVLVHWQWAPERVLFLFWRSKVADMIEDVWNMTTSPKLFCFIRGPMMPLKSLIISRILSGTIRWAHGRYVRLRVLFCNSSRSGSAYPNIR